MRGNVHALQHAAAFISSDGVCWTLGNQLRHEPIRAKLTAVCERVVRQMFSGIEPGTCLAVCLPMHSSPLTPKVLRVPSVTVSNGDLWIRDCKRLLHYATIIFNVTGGPVCSRSCHLFSVWFGEVKSFAVPFMSIYITVPQTCKWKSRYASQAVFLLFRIVRNIYRINYI